MRKKYPGIICVVLAALVVMTLGQLLSPTPSASAATQPVTTLDEYAAYLAMQPVQTDSNVVLVALAPPTIPGDGAGGILATLSPSYTTKVVADVSSPLDAAVPIVASILTFSTIMAVGFVFGRRIIKYLFGMIAFMAVGRQLRWYGARDHASFYGRLFARVTGLILLVTAIIITTYGGQLLLLPLLGILVVLAILRPIGVIRSYASTLTAHQTTKGLTGLTVVTGPAG